MTRTTVVVFLTSLATLMCFPGKQAFVGMALADDNMCSVATLRGPYVVYGQGTVFIGTPHVAQEVDVGSFTSDGKGNIVGSTIFSLNGKIFRTKFTGTYLVNTDCIVTATVRDDLGEVLHEEGVIFDGGSEFRFIGTDPGALIARVARRVKE